MKVRSFLIAYRKPLTGSLEASEDEYEYEDEDGVPQLQGERNSQLTIGYKGDRSYVVRGNNIGVFSHSRDDQVKYYATISNISTPKGKEFKPQEVFQFLRILTSTKSFSCRSCCTIRTRKWSS
jgi:hypothetical protein